MLSAKAMLVYPLLIWGVRQKQIPLRLPFQSWFKSVAL
jgi:hypothetical protein